MRVQMPPMPCRLLQLLLSRLRLLWQGTAVQLQLQALLLLILVLRLATATVGMGTGTGTVQVTAMAIRRQCTCPRCPYRRCHRMGMGTGTCLSRHPTATGRVQLLRQRHRTGQLMQGTDQLVPQRHQDHRSGLTATATRSRTHTRTHTRMRTRLHSVSGAHATRTSPLQQTRWTPLGRAAAGVTGLRIGRSSWPGSERQLQQLLPQELLVARQLLLVELAAA